MHQNEMILKIREINKQIKIIVIYKNKGKNLGYFCNL